jgi:DNA-binding transcriptional ArsR family regulator
VPERQLPPDRTIDLSDPRTMRAYAHPLRLRLIGMLRREGSMTATQAASRLGESSGSCSFHLRQLAKYGLVEEAGGGRGREKPWRATAAFTTLGDPGGDPARADARRRLDSVLLSEIYLEAIDRWLATRADDPPEWREAAGYRDLSMPLTAAELTELRERMDDLIRPYLRRYTGEAEAPPGARPVMLIEFAFPYAP